MSTSLGIESSIMPQSKSHLINGFQTKQQPLTSVVTNVKPKRTTKRKPSEQQDNNKKQPNDKRTKPQQKNGNMPSNSNGSHQQSTNVNFNSNATSNKKQNQQSMSSFSSSSSSMEVYFDPSRKQRDPFLLVDCHQFSDDLMPPFNVKIKLDALALMDLHAHCVHNEVIGCLGGFYCRVTRTLHVLAAEPCFSIDDNETRCEMDPVSQAKALEKLEQKNFQLVGWYHSHPTFLPNPSLRDIDTQNYYQNIFTNQKRPQKPSQDEMKDHNVNDGSSSSSNNNSRSNGTIDHNPDDDDTMDSHPFVAFIISPYVVPNVHQSTLKSKSFTRYEPLVEYPINAKFYANNKAYVYHHQYSKSYCYFTQELNSFLASPIKCFWVGDSKYSKTQLPFKQRNLLIPYEMETSIIRDENFIPSITNRLSEMCQSLFQHHSKPKSVVNLLKRFTRIGSINVTYLEKLLASLSHHLQNPTVSHLCTENECERVRIECVAILTQELMRMMDNQTQGSRRR